MAVFVEAFAACIPFPDSKYIWTCAKVTRKKTMAASQHLVYLKADLRGLKTAVISSNSLRDLKRKITTLAGKNTGAVTLFRWDEDAHRRGEPLSEDDMDLFLDELNIMDTSVFVAQGAGECTSLVCKCTGDSSETYFSHVVPRSSRLTPAPVDQTSLSRMRTNEPSLKVRFNSFVTLNTIIL